MNSISSLPGSFLRRWTRLTMALLLALLVLILSACTTYSHTHTSPGRSYAYQPRASYYYPPNYLYYGSYRPGWSVGVGFGSGYYGGGVYGSWSFGGTWGSPYGWAAPYWPTYAVPYYQPRYRYAYGYHDPWYYTWPGFQVGLYGYGYASPHWPGYRYGYGHGYYNPYGSGYYGGRPYYGGSNGYRSPTNQQPGQQPGYQRPDPVTIPRDQRGRREWDRDNGYYARDYQRGDYQGRNYQGRDGQAVGAPRPQPQEAPPAELRSTTVVTEQRGMSRSVSVAPGSGGEQGMVVSNRGEQKVRQSRMHPVVAPPDGVPPTAVAIEHGYSRTPRAAGGSPAYAEPARQMQQPSQPAYQHRVDSSNDNGRADRSGPGESDREQDR
jgi:hypothetical protein